MIAKNNTSVFNNAPSLVPGIWNLQSKLIEALQDNDVDAIAVDINEGYVVVKIKMSYKDTGEITEIKNISAFVISQQIGSGSFVDPRLIEEGITKKLVLTVLLPEPQEHKLPATTDTVHNALSWTENRQWITYSTAMIIIGIAVLLLGLIYYGGTIPSIFALMSIGKTTENNANGKSNGSFADLFGKKLQEVKQDIARLIHDGESINEKNEPFAKVGTPSAVPNGKSIVKEEGSLNEEKRIPSHTQFEKPVQFGPRK